MTEAVQTALIASGSALVGGLLASANGWILHRLDEQKALRQIRRDKLEAIADGLAATMEWFLEASSARTFEELASCSQCPEVRTAYNLSCLYFPSLRLPIGEYSDGMIHLHSFLVEVYQPFDPLTAGGQAAKNGGYDEVLSKVHALRMAAEAELQRLAAKYNKA